MACEYCNYTDHVPTHIESTFCSDFVPCPKCKDDTEFKKIMGWTPNDSKDG